MYNYGKCDICGAAMEERKIQQDFWVNSKLVVVENVPAGVCPQCGAKVVKADVGLWIDKLLRDSKRIKKAPLMSVPVVRYEAEVVSTTRHVGI